MRISQANLEKLSMSLNSFLCKKTIPSLRLILEEPVVHSLVSVHEVSLMNFNSVISNIEEVDMMSAAYVKCSGDIRMSMLLYLPEQESKILASKLLGTPISEELDGMALSSISEMGNMMSASLVNAISDDTGYRICSSVPGCAVEFFRTLIDAVVSDFANESDALIVSNVELRGMHSGIVVRLLLIQDPDEVPKFL